MHGLLAGNGNRRQRRRRRSQMRDGRRLAVWRAFNVAQLVNEKGLSTRDAALGYGSNHGYVEAALTLIQSENTALLNHVLAGHISLLSAAKSMKNAAAAITAYRKFSNLEREVFRAATGATADLGTLLLNSTHDQLAAASKERTPEWIWDRMIMPVTSTSEPTEVVA